MNGQFWSMQPGAAGGSSLYILDEIARYRSWYFDTVTPKQFQRDLDRCNGELQVWIDSPGGDTFAGSAIYGMLRAYSASGRGKVIANIVGLAASAAGLIAMAADEVRISLTGTFMLHDPLCSMQGNSEALRRNADVLDEIREGQIAAYMRKSGKSHDEVLGLIRGEGTYMNAQTAIENGFADSILNDDGGAWAKAMTSARVSSCASREAEQVLSIAKHRQTTARSLATPAMEAAAATIAPVWAEAAGAQSSAAQEPTGNPTPNPPEEADGTDAEREAQVRALLIACIH